MEHISEALYAQGDTVPLVMMGYSYGTYVAYECALYLQQQHQQPIAHLVSVAGIPADKLDSSMTAWPSYPGDTPVEKLRSLLAATNGGKVPEEFARLDHLGPALIIGKQDLQNTWGHIVTHFFPTIVLKIWVTATTGSSSWTLARLRRWRRAAMVTGSTS